MGMGKADVEKIKYFLSEWELRICILLSLFLQILLILAGPLRKRVSHKVLDILLWSAYLLADGTAIFAVGLIASKQADYSNILHTFWAPFLLAHLGGPDPITAFALEDNELWLRHLFSLFTQCIPVAYVFYQSLTPNKLLIPSLLMFLCGIIKYAERTYALYCSSTKTFRDSILNEPAGKWALPLKDIYTFQRTLRISCATDLKPLEVVKYAFFCFSYFKGLVVDLIFSFPDHSSIFFLERSWNDAFRVVEVELNFLYDVLFTKLTVVDHRVGFGCRVVSVSAIVTSLVLFHYVDKKNLEPEGFEVEITYILLIGGIVLEVIAFFMLVFSDWTVVKLERFLYDNPNEQSWKRMFMDFIVNVNVRRREIICWLLNIGGVRGGGSHYVSKTTDSRWAESISGYNYIYYCVRRRSRAKEKIYDLIGIRAFLDEMVNVKHYPLPSYVKEFIFEELKTKSRTVYDADTAKHICSAKGDWVLETEGYKGSYLYELVKDLEYDESLLLWHIATELCYNDKTDIRFHPPEHNRKIAKLISDYMIYLLVVKPGMMSAVSRKVIISFRETCDEAKDIFDEISTKEKLLPEVELQGIACDRFMDSAKKKTTQTSILFNAANLATELKKLEFDKRWMITSKVWAELLSYGASHIKSNAHAQQLSKGGEFITVVWLLMTHLCLVDQFEGPPKFGAPPKITQIREGFEGPPKFGTPPKITQIREGFEGPPKFGASPSLLN